MLSGIKKDIGSAFTGNVNGTWNLGAVTYSVDGCYRMTFRTEVSIQMKNNIILVEGQNNKVYFGIDGSRDKIRCRVHNDRSSNKNPANDIDLEVMQLLLEFKRTYNYSEPSKYRNVQELLADLVPYVMLDDIYEDNMRGLKHTVAWKKISNVVKAVNDKMWAEIVIGQKYYKDLGNRHMIPLAWMDFNKEKFYYHQRSDVETDRAGLMTLQFDPQAIKKACDSHDLRVPRFLFSAIGDAPYLGKIEATW